LNGGVGCATVGNILAKHVQGGEDPIGVEAADR
jgi:hypothetical protein